MKNFFLSALILAGVFRNSFAQNIPTGDMETWNAVASYYEPQGWMTSNPVAALLGASPGVTKSSDFHGGAFSAKLQTTGSAPVIPGAMAAGTAAFSLGGLALKGGFVYSNRAQSISGYYKYTPGAGDSSLIQAWLFKWNSSTMKRDTVATLRAAQGSTISNYTSFSINFIYHSGATGDLTPDSAMVLISASRDVLAAKIGSVLFVDDLAFTGNVPVGEKKIEKVLTGISVYPNPVTSFVNFKISNRDAVKINLFDILGKKIKSEEVTGAVTSFSVEELHDGLYFYQVANKEDEVLTTGRFSVRK